MSNNKLGRFAARLCMSVSIVAVVLPNTAFAARDKNNSVSESKLLRMLQAKHSSGKGRAFRHGGHEDGGKHHKRGRGHGHGHGHGHDDDDDDDHDDDDDDHDDDDDDAVSP
jgi:hypothetical protein